MKTAILLTLMAIATATSAFGDARNVSVTIDGQIYSCSGGSTPPTPPPTVLQTYCICQNSGNWGEVYKITILSTGQQLKNDLGLEGTSYSSGPNDTSSCQYMAKEAPQCQ